MFRRSKAGVFLLMLTVWQLSVPAKLLADNWTATPGQSLQPLIDRAGKGDHLYLPDGRYPGSIRIERSLTIEGNGGAIIDGDGQGNAVVLTAPDTVLDGITIENWGHNLTRMDAGIFVEETATNSVIRNSRLKGPGFGIWLDAVNNMRVSHNVIRGDTQLRSQDRGNGIHLFNVRNARIESNNIAGTRDGIYIDNSSQNLLNHNRLHDLRYGIHYMYAYDNHLEGNHTSNTRTGYALMQSKRLTVIDNRSDGDLNYGILMNNITNSTLRGNNISGIHQRRDASGNALVSGAEGKALFVYNSQYNHFSNNRFADSNIGIHLTAGSEDNDVTNNAFIGNRQQVMYVATRSQQWNRNYWSNYLGWDLDDDGIGDTSFEPNDAMDRLLWKHPAAKLLMDSPAVIALRWVQRQFPVFRPQGVHDDTPLMKVPDAVPPSGKEATP